MSIHDTLTKIKTLDSTAKERIFVIVLIILVGTASFGLGRLSGEEGREIPVRIESFSSSTPKVLGASTESETGEGVVASKTGTAYYYSTCTGANRVAEKNKITFKSAKEAEAFGLHIGPGCRK